MYYRLNIAKRDIQAKAALSGLIDDEIEELFNLKPRDNRTNIRIYTVVLSLVPVDILPALKDRACARLQVTARLWKSPLAQVPLKRGLLGQELLERHWQETVHIPAQPRLPADRHHCPVLLNRGDDS